MEGAQRWPSTRITLTWKARNQFSQPIHMPLMQETHTNMEAGQNSLPVHKKLHEANANMEARQEQIQHIPANPSFFSNPWPNANCLITLQYLIEFLDCCLQDREALLSFLIVGVIFFFLSLSLSLLFFLSFLLPVLASFDPKQAAQLSC